MKKIIILVCVLLLSGCSAKFAYNNIDWLIYWYIDDYVELNDAQEDQFDGMLANWKQWHQSEELPKYATQMQEIMDDIKNKAIDHNRVTYHREKLRAHWERARAHVAPDILKLARTLDDEQIVYLFAALEEMNNEDEEEMLDNREQSEQKREKKWIKRNQKNIKRWLGKLSDEQKQFIGGFRERFESTGFLWLQYKRDYQRALRAAFMMDTRDEAFDTRMLDLIVNPEQFRSEAFLQANEHNIQASSDYFVGLLQMSSIKQIDNLIDEISGFKEDVVSLQK